MRFLPDGCATVLLADDTVASRGPLARQRADDKLQTFLAAPHAPVAVLQVGHSLLHVLPSAVQHDETSAAASVHPFSRRNNNNDNTAVATVGEHFRVSKISFLCAALGDGRERPRKTLDLLAQAHL